MYRSQEYLEIGGKLITCPYSENDYMYGINLHDLLCRLHASGAYSADEFQSIIITSIECDTALSDNSKVHEIYYQIMMDLANLGIVPDRTAN